MGAPAVTAVGSLATAAAAPVTAPTTAPATMVSRTSPVFSIRLFTAVFRLAFGLAFAFALDAPPACSRAGLPSGRRRPPVWTCRPWSRSKQPTFASIFLGNDAAFLLVPPEGAGERPLADVDEGLEEGWALEDPPLAADERPAAFFLVVGMSVSVVRIGMREMGVEQVVLQRAEVASQLLAGLGDGGAEGRRMSVARPARRRVAPAVRRFRRSGP